jgi:hypothetical protein
METKLSIDDLYTDSGSFDEQRILKILQGKIVFTKENEIIFVTDPNKLKAGGSILLYALAKKILALHKKIDSEIITSAEVASKTKIRPNTIDVSIMRLKDKKTLLPAGNGYQIPVFKIEEIVSLLTKNKQK